MKQKILAELDKKITFKIGEGINKRKDLFFHLSDDLSSTCEKLKYKKEPIVLLDRRLFQLKKQKKIRHARVKNPDKRYVDSYGWFINGVNYLS